MSAINHDKKTIFVHIPRTSGTSMESDGKFGTVETAHFGIQDYHNQGAKLDEYFKFAFVRNPYDRLASAIFAFLLKNEKDPRAKFNETVIKYKEKWPTQIATKPQHTFLTLNGELELDFLGIYENLQKDWKRLCTKLDIEFELPHHKKGTQSYEDLYTPETRKIVQDIYEKDFEMFAYER